MDHGQVARRRIRAVLAAAGLALSAAWPQGAQGADNTEQLEIATHEGQVMIRAYEMPLDDLLHSLGETFGFAVQVDCGTEACPPFSGRLSGGLEAVLGLVLQGRNYSLTHGAPAEPGGPTRLESLAVLAGPRAPDESLPEGPTWGDGPAITVWETNPVPPPGQQADGELGGELGVEGVKRIFATVGAG